MASHVRNVQLLNNKKCRDQTTYKRVEVYKIAQAKNPDRWSKNTRNWSMIQEVKLNPGKLKKVTDIKFAA